VIGGLLRILRLGPFQLLIEGKDVSYRKETRIGRPNCGRVSGTDVFFELCVPKTLSGFG
jgi:hypothetical protein